MKNSNVQNVVAILSNGLLEQALTWSRVAKQLSGKTDDIKLPDGTIVSAVDAWAQLGVEFSNNKITPRALFNAWAPQLKSDAIVGEQGAAANTNVSAVPQVVKQVSVSIEVGAKKFRLYTRNQDGKLEAVKRSTRMNVVNAADKKTGMVAVDAKVVLLGLQQSIEIEKTLADMERNNAKVDAIMAGLVNMGTKDEPVWTAVEKVGDMWHTVEKKASKPAKRTNKKTVKPTRESA